MVPYQTKKLWHGQGKQQQNEVSDKELISKVLKKSHNSSTRNKEPNLKMGRRHEYILPKKTYR